MTRTLVGAFGAGALTPGTRSLPAFRSLAFLALALAAAFFFAASFAFFSAAAAFFLSTATVFFKALSCVAVLAATLASCAALNSASL